MQSPRSYGHFEMRLTYEGLLVAKLWAFKKIYIWNLPQIQPQGYCNSDSLFPPGSFVHQDSEKYNITPCPALIPGDHQVIAFLAPCLVGFTFDLATDLSHPLKPNQIVVLLVVK